MSWRTMMKTEDNISNPKSNNSNNSNNSNISNISNIKRKDLVKANIADIADIAPKNEKVKTYQQQHDHLWQKAWNLANWIDNPGPEIPWQERTAKVPELQAMSLELDQLEKLMRDKLLPLIHTSIMIFLCNIFFTIHIAVLDQVKLNALSHVLGHLNVSFRRLQDLAGKEFYISHARSF